MYATLELLHALYRRRRRPSTAQLAPSRMEATLDHVAFSARDPMLLVTFYTSVLHLTAEKVEEYQAGKVLFPSVRLNPATIIDFIPTSNPDAVVRTGHICMCITKDAFEALIVRLAKHNIPTEGPPKLLSGARGDGWALYVQDPEKNMLEFRWYP